MAFGLTSTAASIAKNAIAEAATPEVMAILVHSDGGIRISCDSVLAWRIDRALPSA
jgi:hypothetical protein